MSMTPDPSAAELAEQIRAAFPAGFLDRPFGVIRFWRFAVVRPNDQSFVLVSTHAEADRLDLVFVHEQRAGLASVLSIWGATGLQISDDGLTLRGAARLKLDDTEAWLDGERYGLRTPRGEGGFDVGDALALTLGR